MDVFLSTTVWVTAGVSVVRELLHLVLPADAAMTLSWELALSTLPVAYVYERRATPKRVSSGVVALVAATYAALAVLFERLVFPASEARFWVTMAVVAPAVLVGQALYYQLGWLDPPATK